jgi:hypothetical protein
VISKPYKPRTLDELSARVIFLQDRLEKMMADPVADDETKAFVRQYEEATINNLKDQIRFRIGWYLKCIGC